jgi:L-ribulokinase
MGPYVIGLDFGTNSARALLVEAETGREVATYVHPYSRGTEGVLTDPSDALLARQDPRDYIDALEVLVPGLMQEARETAGVRDARVIGIGVDTTASTPVPVDGRGQCLTLDGRFADNTNACAWLWKDHTAHREAEEIVEAVKGKSLPYLSAYSGVYSSEWFWAKVLRATRTDAGVAAAAATGMAHSDFIPALLTGDVHPAAVKRNACAAGFKGMYGRAYGGFPPEEFFGGLDERLGTIRRSLPARVYAPGEPIGTLAGSMKEAWGLGGEIVVASGMIDAHAGAVGSGIRPGRLVKMIGTSTCDLALLSTDGATGSIPGISGVVADGIVPGWRGVESGQAAVGDILNWFVDTVVCSGTPDDRDRAFARLTEEAGRFRAGATGLVALDWNNGNRNVLMDPMLTGLVIGQTLQTGPGELFRALIEATGFGARVITERLREHGVALAEIVCCGGIAEKNPLFMQIYADILNCPISVARSGQAAALGSAVCAAVAAGPAAGGYDNFPDATEKMTGIRETVYLPRKDEAATYDRLYRLYLRLHDVFGKQAAPDCPDNLFDVMKGLIEIRERTRRL